MDARKPLSAPDARRRAEESARLLARDPRVLLVYLFGSAAQPGRGRARDLDLAVMSEPRFTVEELLKRRAELVSATGASIDLVSLNDASIVLAHEVVESGRCLYAQRPEIETDFVTRARARYWDFKPFREEQWRLAGARLEERRSGS